MKLECIVSGGQTGADQGGLDGAILEGFPHSGWCPKGRISEIGRIPDKYILKEHSSSAYPPRTRTNVKDSDGTVIFTIGKMERGSALTRNICSQQKKPWIHIDLYTKSVNSAVKTIYGWIRLKGIKVLNVAGNRESKAKGIQGIVSTIISDLIKELKGESRGRNVGNKNGDKKK